MAKTSKSLLDEARASIKQVGAEEARDLMKNSGAVVVDVRESDEWRQGHIPEAIFIPRGFLELRVEDKIPDHKAPVILQCASGTRSLLAARTLREMGYENLYNMNGGFNAWKDKGLPWVADRQFTPDELTRYSRHFLIPEVGEKGQAKLLDAKVLLLGAGALGSPSGMYLAAAGVGTIGFVDFDVVDLSNLQRQIIHATDRVGMLKTESAQKTINAINPAVKVIAHNVHLSSENVMDIIRDYDVVVNCSDNFPTRYLINDACVFAKKPLVDGAIFQFEGNATVFDPAKGGPCYRCLYPEPPPPGMAPSCAEAGVLGVLPGLIGSIEALEAIKLILGVGKPLIGTMVYFDTLSDRDFVRLMRIKRDAECPVCGDHPTQTKLIDYEAFCGLAANGASANGDAATPVQPEQAAAH
ncbi:MAG TPA: molybdopterin-synthase adenylyltransferase MoeB [Candidatus Binataceae bacterium]|jgi:molybdopterin/thiamine biosynthesis adenylyltransferase/rhodanese-related sulfurtransferase|nr:molybdopterin-synthase adenylyltransferase MoeB [Candidatus Binataceae bacterium]